MKYWQAKHQCRAPASKGKTKFRFHGGADTGPRTELGRLRCAEAKTIHGNGTRIARLDRTAAMRRLRALEDLGYALGIIRRLRMPGSKPKRLVRLRSANPFALMGAEDVMSIRMFRTAKVTFNDFVICQSLLGTLCCIFFRNRLGHINYLLYK